MSLIKGSDTKPEMMVRRYLFSKGFRYRVCDKSLPGTPDIKLPKHKTVIFVHGCFWHGHKKCNSYKMPKSNKKFWRNKIERNIKRDTRATRELKNLGWKVIIVWQCQLKRKKLGRTFVKLEKLIGRTNC